MVRLLVVVLLVLTAAGSLAGASPGRTSINAATYEDERGEEAGAPDIATVSVSNDDGGNLTFFVSVPSHPQLTQDMRVRLWFSDGDPSTGLTLGGADHFVLVDGYLLGVGNAAFYDCDRTDTCRPAELRGASFTYARGASFTLPADAFGIDPEQWGSTRIDFTAFVGAGYGYDPMTRQFDFTNARIDRAPSDDGTWSYEARIGPGALVTRRLTTMPAVARAGERLVARMPVVRDDTGVAIRSGVVTCSARIGSRHLRSRPGSFVERQAQCVFDVPMGTRNRTLRGSISVSRGTLTAERSFVRSIR
jgi:hypothetical protein